MLLYRGMIFLLDWERSGIGDPAFEAGLIPIFCALDSEAQKYFYDAYIDLSIDSPRMLERIEAYRLVHVLAWPMHMLSFLYRLKLEGCTTTWNPDEFVEAYLSEAYGWLAYAVRALAPVLGFPELAGMREPQLRSMGTLFAWNGQAL